MLLIKCKAFGANIVNKYFNNGCILPQLVRTNLRRFHSMPCCLAKLNYYEVLGLKGNESCSNREIRDAYLKKCKEFHPDRHMQTSSGKTISYSKAEFNKKFQEINEAYMILSKDDERRNYDAELSQTPPLDPFDFRTKSGTNQFTYADILREYYEQLKRYENLYGYDPGYVDYTSYSDYTEFYEMPRKRKNKKKKFRFEDSHMDDNAYRDAGYRYFENLSKNQEEYYRFRNGPFRRQSEPNFYESDYRYMRRRPHRKTHYYSKEDLYRMADEALDEMYNRNNCDEEFYYSVKDEEDHF